MFTKRTCFLIVFLLIIFSTGCAPVEAPEQAANEPPADLKKFPSPDAKYTVYIADQGLYIGEGGDFAKARKIETGRDVLQDISWSPNSGYFFAGNDTRGIVMKPHGDYDVFSVRDYETGPFWAPAGDKVGFTIRSRIYVDGISRETMDVVIKKLDNETLGGVRLARGTLDYYFKMDSWGEDGVIRYSKYARSDDRLLEKLTSEFAHHLFSIDLETHTKKEIAMIKDLEYLYFIPSPDRKLLSMVKLTFSGGEAEGGIPCFYDMNGGSIFSLEEESTTWFWDAWWFSDSARILFNEYTVYDARKRMKTPFDFADDIVLLGGAPSPDGTRIAVLSCQAVGQTGSRGETVTVDILSVDGRSIKTIRTSLLPFWNNNIQGPIPVNFIWLPDNRHLLAESWELSDIRRASLWKINIGDGSVVPFADNAEDPLLSPDGQKVLSLTREDPAKGPMTGMSLCVRSLDGTVWRQLTSKEYEDYGYPVKMIWDDKSGRIVFNASNHSAGSTVRTLICWDLESGKVDGIRVDPTTEPLYVQDGKIVCIDGYIYQ